MHCKVNTAGIREKEMIRIGQNGFEIVFFFFYILSPPRFAPIDLLHYNRLHINQVEKKYFRMIEVSKITKDCKKVVIAGKWEFRAMLAKKTAEGFFIGKVYLGLKKITVQKHFR